MSTRGVVLMYSVTSRPSFSEVEKIRKKILSLKPESIKVPMVLVGNKSDSLHFERQVTFKEGEMLSKRLGCAFKELSVKNDDVSSVLILLVKEIVGLHQKSQEILSSLCGTSAPFTPLQFLN
jgi:GTPase SAR1 family protein